MKEMMKRLAPAISRQSGKARSNRFASECRERESHSTPLVRQDELQSSMILEQSANSAAPNERRSEPRRYVKSDVILTPLDDVSKRFRGTTLNISEGGMRVRLDRSSGQPGDRQVYRIETPTNRVLGEVRNSAVVPASVEVGFEIVSGPQAPLVAADDRKPSKA